MHSYKVIRELGIEIKQGRLPTPEDILAIELKYCRKYTEPTLKNV